MSGRWEDCPCCGEATFPDGSRQWDGTPTLCGCNCWVSVDEDEDGEEVGYITYDGVCERCCIWEQWVDGPDSEARRAARACDVCGYDGPGHNAHVCGMTQR